MMLTGTIVPYTLHHFSELLQGAVIVRVEWRDAGASKVLAICVRQPDGGLDDFVLRAVVPYEEPSKAEIYDSVIRHPRGLNRPPAVPGTE